MAFSQFKHHRSVTAWLGIMCLLVMAIIVVGGATRLTNSGLSITEWKPITGAIPPLSQEAWAAEFEKYKQIPEFEAEHPDMTLKEFEFIYFWEWGHRQLGRLIGLVYALPFLFFLFRGMLPVGRRRYFTAILFLIGMQGAIGWWMVHSGLQEGMVSVSQYRLATHLGMAFLILGLLLWLFLDSANKWPAKEAQKGHKRMWGVTGLIYLQIIAGAFVAGLGAGKAYTTWPAMDGGFVPSGYWVMSPFWRNLFENVAAVQFNHRVLAYIVVAAVIYAFFFLRREGAWQTGRAKMALLILTIWQVVLGIWTLVSAAPLNLSLMHQASAIALFVAAVWTLWTTKLEDY